LNIDLFLATFTPDQGSFSSEDNRRSAWERLRAKAAEQKRQEDQKKKQDDIWGKNK